MNLKISVVAVIAALLLAAVPVNAQVGEPSAFSITVKQGNQVIAQKAVTVGPGGDLQDIKVADGDPEDFVQLITMAGSGQPSPIILKLVSEPLADTAVYRLLHFYIDVPLSLANINLPGLVSLFNPLSSDQIEVSITNMVFSNGVVADPHLENTPLFYTSFMRDRQGHFYESPMAHPYNYNGSGIYDIQVPATAYLDADPSQYTFAATSGVSSSWTWGHIPNPGLGTTVHNGFNSGVTPVQPGYVFELGLAVAITAVPEPSTLSLLVLGLWMIRRTARPLPRV
jgi:hypothetical protein